MSPDTLLTAAALLLPGFWAVGARRRLVDLRQAARAAWLRVDERLRLRHELLLRFVEAAGPALPASAEQLAALAAARNSAAAARQGAASRPGAGDALDQLARAEAALDAALGRLVEPVLTRAASCEPTRPESGAAASLPDSSATVAAGAAGAAGAGRPAGVVGPVGAGAPVGTAGAAVEAAAVHPFFATPAGMAQAAEAVTGAAPGSEATPEPSAPPVVFPPPGLFDELDAVCTQLDVARHAFNAAVGSYDAAVGQFPARLLALPLGLRPLATAAMLGSRIAFAPLVTPGDDAAG